MHVDSAPFYGGSKGCKRHLPVAPVAPHERAGPGTAVSSVHRIGSARPVEQPETQHNPSPHGEVVLEDVASGRAQTRHRCRGRASMQSSIWRLLCARCMLPESSASLRRRLLIAWRRNGGQRLRGYACEMRLVMRRLGTHRVASPHQANRSCRARCPGWYRRSPARRPHRRRAQPTGFRANTPLKAGRPCPNNRPCGRIRCDLVQLARGGVWPDPIPIYRAGERVSVRQRT